MAPSKRRLRLRPPNIHVLSWMFTLGVVALALHQLYLAMVLSFSPDHDEDVPKGSDKHRNPSLAFMPTFSAAFRPLSVGILSDTKNDTRQRAVFYNIYVPPGEFEEHALGIVKEQLALKRASKLLQNVPLFYTLIGTNVTDVLSDLCELSHRQEQQQKHMRRQDPLESITNCRLLRYSSQGDESLTLQSIHDYCIDKPDDVQVTYLHNKGSFHPSDRNENFRAFLNHGIFGPNGEYCQQMPLEECNVCGTRFATFPHYHMAGNMWTATCKYIRQLIPPLEFPARMEALLERSLFLQDPDIPKPTFQQYSEGYAVGRGRYSLEHWLCSHPDLQPCDIYSRKYTHGYRDLPHPHTKWTAKLAKAPRFDIHTFLKISMLRGAWYCGQARLWEYAFLYRGLQPKPEHFVWKYYLETYKGCDMPLNYTFHNDMFRAKLNGALNGTTNVRGG